LHGISKNKRLQLETGTERMAAGKDLVSIAMTTYNGARFLEKQLDSIYSQTYRNIEVFVCDDGSTDGTVRILEEYKNRYGLNYLINEKHLGFIKNFEKAIGLCKGKFIALADQDDIWLPQKIERLVQGIGDHSLIYSDASYIDENGTVFAPSIRQFTGNIFFSGKPLYMLFFRNCVTGCTILFKRELLDDGLPVPSEMPSHDWWLTIVACKKNGICPIDEPLVLYRKHESNTLGLGKAPGKFFQLFSFLLPKKWERHFFEAEEKRLKILMDHDLFNEKEKFFLAEAKAFYYDIVHTRIHFKAFIIGVRQRKYIFSHFKGIWRLKLVLGTLFR
jgi:glycosyltransferase involved in cell wall biosynthesis